MYRDISNADIIYITRNAGANTDLYKLSGAYTASLVDMNIASGSNLISIDNISQWDANNMYVAAIEVVGDVKRGIIFHGDPTSGEGFEAIYETDELEDWTNIYDGEYGFYAVGKFEAGTPPVHYLWVADGYHGMQYIEKIEGSPPVVTNIPAGLNAYVPRDMERDRILSSGSTVKILLGTWMGGLWELGFDINDSLKIYDLSKRRDLK
jgi:hypothetical protein